MMKKINPLSSVFIFGILVCFLGISMGEAVQKANMNQHVKKKDVHKTIAKKNTAGKSRQMANRKSDVRLSKQQARKNDRVKKSLQVWLKKMKKRIARSHAKHNQLVAVGAVRGSRSEPAPLYWKGKESNGPVDLPELQIFEDALNQALGGNNEVALKKLDNFVKKYPKSALVEDANHTIAMLKKPEQNNPQLPK